MCVFIYTNIYLYTHTHENLIWYIDVQTFIKIIHPIKFQLYMQKYNVNFLSTYNIIWLKYTHMQMKISVIYAKI